MENTPQLENGYTRIANGILESLAKLHLSSYQNRILLCILRKTYGFGKKEDWISNSQFVEFTKIRSSHVSRAVSELLLMKIVTKRGNKTSFQKDSTLWTELPIGVRRHDVVTKRGISKLPNGGDTKETITKEIISKDIKEVRTSYVLPIKRSYGNADINTLLDTISKMTPTGKLDGSEKDNRRMANSIIKKYTLETALKALRNVKGSFYEGKINSARNLYNNFNALLNVKADTRTTDLSDLISNSYKKL